MATRVRKTPAVTPTEPPVETVVTTRRRATTSRAAATRRVASSSRSQRIVVGADALAESEPPAVPETATLPDAPPAPAVEIPEAVIATPLLVLVEELSKLLLAGQDRLSQELAKSHSQTVRNVSGLAHDVDRLMTLFQGLLTRMTQIESLLSRVEATLVPLSRGISATLLPVKGIEKPVNAETLDRGLAAALAPLLAELIEIRAQRSRESSLAQVEQQILLTELRRLRSVALPPAERTTNPLMAVGKVTRRSSTK